MTLRNIRIRRIADGATGWYREGVIHPDYDPTRPMYAYWLTNSEWDQEDLGLPAAGYLAFDGWWEDVSQSA